MGLAENARCFPLTPKASDRERGRLILQAYHIPMRLTPLRPPPYSLDRESLESEVEVDAFRARGPGGQHVNKTNSALRLTHPPSGVVVIAQDSPSQVRNRETAFARLITRLQRLNYVPKKRIATKPSRAAKERRLEAKKQQGSVKKDRAKSAER